MDTQKALDTGCTSHDADSMNCIQDTPSMSTPSSVLAAPCEQGEGGVSHSSSSSMSASSIMPGSSKSTSSCSGNDSCEISWQGIWKLHRMPCHSRSARCCVSMKCLRSGCVPFRVLWCVHVRVCVVGVRSRLRASNGNAVPLEHSGNSSGTDMHHLKLLVYEAFSY